MARRIKIGDVIGVAVDGLRRPPVGEVIDTDDRSVTLALFSWISGYCDAGEMVIDRTHVRATVWTRPLTDSEKQDRKLGHEPGVVWHMEPLAEFQREWSA